MICGNCKSECRKVTIKFFPAQKEECEKCADGGLHLEPAWKRDKPTPLWESRPWLYKKTTGKDGEAIYNPTDENLADLEAQILKPSADDQAAMERRRNRTPGEIDINKARSIAADFESAYSQAWNQYEEANAEYWNTVADDLKVQ